MITPTLMLLALAAQVQDLPAPVGGVKELREITSLAEVAPGRIVLAQPEEQHVLIVDLNTGETRRVGREGRGPGEFIFPYFVFPLRDRRFAVVDGALARTSYFTSDGTLIADSLIPPRLQRTGLMLDALGRACTSDTAPSSGRGPRGVLYRYFPDADSTLELVTLATVPWVRSIKDPGLTQALSYAAHDEAGILPDGTVWVARHDPPHVEWRSVDVQWTSSRPFPLPRPQTTPADSVFVPGLPGRDRGRPVALPMAEVKGRSRTPLPHRMVRSGSGCTRRRTRNT